MGASHSSARRPAQATNHGFAHPSTTSLDEAWPSQHGPRSAASSGSGSTTSSLAAARCKAFPKDAKLAASDILMQLASSDSRLPSGDASGADVAPGCLDLVLLLHRDAGVLQCFDSNVLELLLRLLASRGAEQQAALLRLLSQLSMWQPLARQLQALGAVDVLMRISGGRVASPNCVARVLTNVAASCGPQARQRMLQRGTHELLARLLCTSLPLKTRCLAALALKALWPAEERAEPPPALLAACWEPLLQLLQQPDATAVRTCCLVLEQLLPAALGDPGTAPAVLQSDTVPRLAACLDSSSAPLLRSVLPVLAQLVAGAPQAAQELARHDLAVGRLARLFGHADAEVQRQSLVLLLALSREPQALAWLAATPGGRAAGQAFLSAVLHASDNIFTAGCEGACALQRAMGSARAEALQLEVEVEEEAAAALLPGVGAAEAAAGEQDGMVWHQDQDQHQHQHQHQEASSVAVLPALLLALRSRPPAARAAALRMLLMLVQRDAGGSMSGEDISRSSSGDDTAFGSYLGSPSKHLEPQEQQQHHHHQQHHQQQEHQQQHHQQGPCLEEMMLDMGAPRLLLESLHSSAAAGDHSSAAAALSILAALMQGRTTPALDGAAPQLVQLLAQLLPAGDAELQLACATTAAQLNLGSAATLRAVADADLVPRLAALLSRRHGPLAERAAAALAHVCCAAPAQCRALAASGAQEQALALLVQGSAAGQVEAARLVSLVARHCPQAAAQARASGECLQQLVHMLRQDCAADGWAEAACCLHALLQPAPKRSRGSAKGSASASAGSSSAAAELPEQLLVVVCEAAQRALQQGGQAAQQHAALLLAQLPGGVLLQGMHQGEPGLGPAALAALGGMLAAGLQQHISSLARRSRETPRAQHSADSNARRLSLCSLSSAGSSPRSSSGARLGFGCPGSTSFSSAAAAGQGGSPRGSLDGSCHLSRLSLQEASFCYLPASFGLLDAEQQGRGAAAGAELEQQIAACQVLARLAAAVQRARGGAPPAAPAEGGAEAPALAAARLLQAQQLGQLLDALLDQHDRLLADVLAALLSSSTSPLLCLPAMHLLAHLADASPEAQQAQVLAGGVLVLTKQLRSSSAACVVAAARGLRSMMAGCDVAASEMVKVGAISQLQQLVRGCSDAWAGSSEDVAREAKQTLRAAVLRRELLGAPQLF
jgi:hypothetical protein